MVTIKKDRLRSPAYPSINLKEAIEKLRVLYDKQKRNAVNVDVAISTLGLKSSGYGGRYIAAMKMFGLLADEGKLADRMVKITDLGLKLMNYQPEDPEYKELITTAAKLPKIYSEMLAEWPEDLPSDDQIRRWLIGRKFNTSYIPSLIADFKTTYEFANLGSQGTISEQDTDKDDEEERVDDQHEDGIKPPRIKPPGGPSSGGKPKVENPVATRTLAIPISNGREILLQAPEKITKEDEPYFALLDSYIQLLKTQAKKPRNQ